MGKHYKKRKRITLRDKTRNVLRVKGVVPTGNEPSPGRPVGSVSKTMPDYKRMKQGLVEVFNSSQAPAIINQMLNMKLPPMLRPQNRDLITAKEDAAFRRLLLKNFMWAVEIVVKTVPKELGVFGKIQQEHSLAGLSRRATQSVKSGKVIDMVSKRRVNDIEEYSVDLDPSGDDDDGRVAGAPSGP